MKRTPSTTFGGVEKGWIPPPREEDESPFSSICRNGATLVLTWTTSEAAARSADIIWKESVREYYIYVVRGGYTPPPSKPVSRAGYFNPYSSVGSRASTERRRVPPNYPQCRLLLIELSIPVPWLSQTRILDFRRISMRGALASFAFLRALSREFRLGKYNFAA